jgi:asparagine synthase (glutamine-hydrolysing)
MSAIAGIYRPNGPPVDHANLVQMIEALAHRGPDRAGVWSEGPVGLGHGMLWTTPESLHEDLPAVNRLADLALTADARIDNRDELITTLGLADRPRGEFTDSELILAAYEKWGEHCPEKLLGDFAFAIWDGRKQVLFCARDHFGVKPFYYYHSDQLFVCASEIKALLSLPEVPCHLNETRVADYLETLFEDKAITFYQHIFLLPPGHSMTVGHTGTRIRPYWSLDPERELQLGSDEAYAEGFLEIFTEAVRCRLRSAFPIGSMLSGGLDSSSITCVARELLAQNGNSRLHTFSAVFDEVPQCDECPFINAVLAQGGLEPHYVHADQPSPLADLDRVLWHENEPFYAPNLFMHWSLYEAAQRQGVRSLLDGFVGDTTVSHGITYMAELAHTGRWITLAKEVKRFAQRRDDSAWESLWHYVWHYSLKPLAPKPVRQAWRALRGRNGPTWSPNPIINPGFARYIGLADRVHALARDGSQPLWSARENHFRDLNSGDIPFALEVADRAAAAFSIEPRYPFLDRRLVEFCLALPAEQKLCDGLTRMILRRALANILPEKVRWREGKGNLGPNFERGLLVFERERLEDVILDPPEAIEAYVDVAALREAYQQYIHQGGEDAISVWLAVTLALWLRYTGIAPRVHRTNGGDGKRLSGLQRLMNRPDFSATTIKMPIRTGERKRSCTWVQDRHTR